MWRQQDRRTGSFGPASPEERVVGRDQRSSTASRRSTRTVHAQDGRLMLLQRRSMLDTDTSPLSSSPMLSIAVVALLEEAGLRSERFE